MKRIILLAATLAATLLFVGKAHATRFKGLQAIDKETLVIQFQDGDVRYRDNGTGPSAFLGHTFVDGDDTLVVFHPRLDPAATGWTVTSEDDPDFGKFWGRVDWPAAHGFYKDKAHLPYDTFDFCRANARRKYGADWERISAERAHARMRAWGLNTIANWSNPAVYGLRRTPYTVQISTSGTPRLEGSTGWWGALPDPFNPEFESTLRKRAKDIARTTRDDPWCIGVFVDNELSWNEEPRMKDVAERYFSTVRRVLRDEMPNHLYLGCRIAWGREVIYEACARHCDVVSVNIYGREPSRDLPPGAEDKPMIVGEFHFGALDRGLFHTGLVATRDQKERAACYCAFVNACLEHPRFVGAHWFQWRDQPLTGRFDGENYQIGFVTVTDAPYPELVEAARKTASGMYQRRSRHAIKKYQ